MMRKSEALQVCVLVLMLLLTRADALDGPSYGVKLCGREFIRAVIFTCGGSRWKRSLTSTDEILDLLTPEEGQGVADGSLLRGSSGVAQQGADFSQEGEVFRRPARSLISEEVLEALRSVDRKGRDVVVGLSNACCKWGCSKGEISSLC